jgi:Terpene cyclase DEP1
MKLRTLYLILCVVGAALPLWQLAPWLAANGLDVPLIFRQLFASRVGAFFGMDVIVSAAVLAVFVWSEGARLRMRLRWLAVAATLGVGVSLGLPLFLYMRERELERRSAAR